MTKVSKTGSSTLFSIFARFVINNELNILSPISPSSAINWWKNENMSAGMNILYFVRVLAVTIVDGFTPHETKYSTSACNIHFLVSFIKRAKNDKRNIY